MPSRMPKTLPAEAPRSPLEVGNGALQGDRDPESSTDEKHVESLRNGLYDLTREAVDRWGGPMALASYLRRAFSNISARLNRREVNGEVQQTFIDYLAVVGTHPESAAAIGDLVTRLFFETAITSAPGRERMVGLFFWLGDRLGYERAKQKKVKTPEEKYEALLKSLKACGPLGEAAIARAAAEAGADVSEFDQ